MAHASAHGHEEHGSLKTYLTVFVVLLVLTVVSFTVGNLQDLKARAPAAIWAFMMAVSVAKALLVILFFMHLKWEANWKYVLTIPCCIMSVFLVLMLMPDVGWRVKYYSEERTIHSTPQSLHYYNYGVKHNESAH